MGMARGTPLVATTAAVVVLTGQQGIDNIPFAAELTITDLLTTASDVIYDKLEQAGIDPTLLTNQQVYERAVAWHFLSILAEAGLLSVDGESAQEAADRYELKSNRYFREVLPKSSEDDVSRMGSESIPRVANLYRDSKVNGKYFYDDLPGRR